MITIKLTMNGKEITPEAISQSILNGIATSIQNKLSPVLSHDEFQKVSINFTSDEAGQLLFEISAPSDITDKIESVLGKTRREKTTRP